jgi:hypothetical protein
MAAGSSTKKRATPTAPTPPKVSALAAEAAAQGIAGKVTALLSVVQKSKPTPGKCQWHLGTVIGLDATQRAALAWLVAQAVMERRCGASSALSIWRTAALSGAKLTGTDRDVVAAFVVGVFGVPGKPMSEDHLIGHVAEWLWYLNAVETVSTIRSIRLLEPPKFNVTEPGADGFIVFSDNATGETSYRLWEIKKHTGTSHVSGTVGTAYTQLTTNAMRYLAQQVSVYSERPDAVGDLCKQLVDLWAECSDRAGAGVGVASGTTPPPATCFTTMGNHFPGFTKAGQLEGLLLAIQDFEGLAREVRSYLWTAL